jgi:hypothetical protein
LPDGDRAADHAAARETYTAPELTRHGNLDELTHGAGMKVLEKTSNPDLG